MFKVKKRNLLLIAGIVWFIAGFNVVRLGIMAYNANNPKWYLYILSVIIFLLFGRMFFKMSQNIQREYFPMKSIYLFGIFLMAKLLYDNDFYDGWKKLA